MIVGGVYSEITVVDQETISFPKNFTGSIRPGSLDHLVLAKSIEWGENMTGPIEPGVIPKCCERLLLHSSYKHPADHIKLEKHVDVFVNYRNVELAPTDRIFTIWKEDLISTPNVPKNAEWVDGLWNDSPFFGKKRARMARFKYPALIKDKKFEDGQFQRLLDASKEVRQQKLIQANITDIDKLARVIKDAVDRNSRSGNLYPGSTFTIQRCPAMNYVREIAHEIFPELTFRVDGYGGELVATVL